MQTTNLNIDLIKSKFNLFTIKTSEGLLLIDKSNIILIESANNYSTIFLSDGTKIFSTKSIGHYEQLLLNDAFLRVHNCFIVNLNCIKRYHKTEDGYLIMTNNKRVYISKAKKETVLFILEN